MTALAHGALFMKSRSTLLTLALLLLSCSAAVGAEGETAPLKVLFIGNSYTAFNDLPTMIVGMADVAGGRKIVTDRLLAGGATLERHLNKTGAVQKLTEQKWDVVVLQEQSLRPIVQRDRMWRFARVWHDKIKMQGAKTVFYLTWARQDFPAMQAGSQHEGYKRAMFLASRSAQPVEYKAWCARHEAALHTGLNGAYFGIARELGATVAPVGIAWQQAIEDNPRTALHTADKSHPNKTGSYLAACVFYATLLDENPVGLPGTIRNGNKLLANVPAAEARRLQTIAWDTVQQSDASR